MASLAGKLSTVEEENAVFRQLLHDNGLETPTTVYSGEEKNYALTEMKKLLRSQENQIDEATNFTVRLEHALKGSNDRKRQLENYVRKLQMEIKATGGTIRWSPRCWQRPRTTLPGDAYRSLVDEMRRGRVSCRRS